MTALVMFLLLVIAAFATDLGAWYRQGQEQQRAADVGALNGVQSYDRATKAYFAEVELNTGRTIQAWSDLFPDEQLTAEQRGLQEAANTVIALLETSGLTFTDAGAGALATNPTDENQRSLWTVVATDGTTIVITRSFVVTGQDAGGADVYSRSIDVVVTAPGEQYFSNVVRDAPEISRSASSVLSNCGAICNQTIEIDPPFAGFDAAGSGDGFKPLIRGESEIWAVNHHVQASWEGDIVCMSRLTSPPSSCGAFALGGSATTGYNTANGPVELLSQRLDGGVPVDKIYAPATRRSDNVAGLLCFDVARKQYCTGGDSNSGFLGFNSPTWVSQDTWGSPSAGVWEYDNKAWVINHKGVMGCVTTSANASGGMQSCGEFDTAIVGHARTQTGTKNRQVWGEIDGNKLYLISRGRSNDALFHCFNLNSKSPCWGGNVIKLGTDYRAGQAMGFFRHNTNGTIAGVCLTVPQKGTHHCVTLTGGAMVPISGFAASQTPLVSFDQSPTNTSKWTGGVYTWEGKRSFFNGGNSDRLTCYSWEAPQGPCGEVDLDQILPGQFEIRTAGPRNGSQEIEPYQLSPVTPNCLVGLGDQSVFFSFNPATLQPCIDTSLSADILPCECADNTGNRWGEVRMPQDLLNKVAKLDATVVDPATGIKYIDNVDILATGGALNLSVVPDSVDLLKLTLDIDALLDTNGDPLWQDPIYADLQITVQPTLTS